MCFLKLNTSKLLTITSEFHIMHLNNESCAAANRLEGIRYGSNNNQASAGAMRKTT